jgi:hypothetical protein
LTQVGQRQTEVEVGIGHERRNILYGPVEAMICVEAHDADAFTVGCAAKLTQRPITR